MQTFDNTRPLVAGMACGVARAALEETRTRLAEAGVEIDYSRPALSQHAAAARFLEMEADYEAALLLTLHAAWMADNNKPNSLQASMAKAKAGRTCVEVTLGCVELCGTVGYGEGELLEKWARDAKILDIFEGTQQIQLLIVARQLLEEDLGRTQVASGKRELVHGARPMLVGQGDHGPQLTRGRRGPLRPWRPRGRRSRAPSPSPRTGFPRG